MLAHILLVCTNPVLSLLPKNKLEPEVLLTLVTPDASPDTSVVPSNNCPNILLLLANLVAEATLSVSNAETEGVIVTDLVTSAVGLAAFVILSTTLTP